MKIRVSSTYWRIGKSSSLGRGKGRARRLFLLAELRTV
jgi:hypothetical protein